MCRLATRNNVFHRAYKLKRSFSSSSPELTQIQQLLFKQTTTLKQVDFKSSCATKIKLEIRPWMNESIQATAYKQISGAGVDSTCAAIPIQAQESETLLQFGCDSSEGENEDLHIELNLPPMMHLNVSLVDGQVDIFDKVEGDVRVSLGRGNISGVKLRGMQIGLSSNDGCVKITNLIEGETIKLAAKEINCKKLMAKTIDVKLSKAENNSTFGAIYASNCIINSSSTGSLKVGNIHGSLEIKSEGWWSR